MKSRITISKRIFLTILTCCLFVIVMNAQTPPAVVSIVPAHNATSVNVTNLITATFDQPIQAGIPGKVLTIWYADTETVYNTYTLGSSLLAISGNTLTLDKTLPYNTNLYISLENGLVKNASEQYNPAYGFSSSWLFTTESDTYSPVLTAMTPPDGSVGVYEGNNLLSYTFNEKVQAGTGNVLVKRVDNDVVTLSIDVTNPSNISVTTSAPYYFTVIPTTGLDYSTEYYVEFPSGVIEDLSGNPFEGIGSLPLTEHSFTMRDQPADTFPPTISSNSPADNATGVDVNTGFVITFNEEVLIGTGSFFVKHSSNGSIAYEIDVSDISVTGNVATIILPDNLFSITNYYITIDAGAFTDLAGNDYAGISINTAWNFQTVYVSDVNPPEASTFNPLDNAANVSVSDNLMLEFNEAIQMYDNAILKDFGGAVIPSTSTVAGNTLTINPTSNLTNSTQYYVEIVYGAIRDLGGNSFAGLFGNTAWNFTTVSSDVTPPSPVIFSPLDNATGVGLSDNITITFDEDVQISGGSPILRDFDTNVEIGSFSFVFSGSNLIINPDADLSNNTQYYIEIADGIIQDMAGNGYAGLSGNTAWNFTTESLTDTTPPTVILFTPLDDGTDVSISNDLELDFSEDIQISGGRAILRDFITNVEINSSSSVVGSKLYVNPDEELSRNTQYYVEISSGIIKDLAGNDFAGFSGNNTWNFTTGFNNETYWNGTSWDNGIPDNSLKAVINWDYNTAVSGIGSINASELKINIGYKLIVSGGDYVYILGNITVDGVLLILDQGSLVQKGNLATVTNNGFIEVEKITPVFSDKDFSFMSSPMSNEAREDVFASASLVRHHLTANFIPHPDVAIDFPLAENFADDNGNNLITHTGLLKAGEGYFVKPFTVGETGGNFNTLYNQGTLNNGVVSFTALYGDDQNDSPNILGNPYASAIDASIFISSNPIVDAVYYWEHLTDPNNSYPGYSDYNYDMGDISIYNLSGGIAAANAGGGVQVSNQFIASGQGFAIKANATGNVYFDNTMRLTDNNNTYRNNESIDRLYIKISNDTYGLKSATLIAFTELATDEFDNEYDAKRLALPVSIFSLVDDRELGIQGRSAFNDQQMISLGFSTQVDETQEYIISLGTVEGNLINQASVYLKDNLLNTITNLSETDYSFTSNQGNQFNRFVIVFEDEFLGNNEFYSESISLYPNPTQNLLNINSPLMSMSSIEIFDLSGRKVGQTNLDNQHSYYLDMSRLKSAVYFIKINTKKGTTTKRVIRE